MLILSKRLVNDHNANLQTRVEASQILPAIVSGARSVNGIGQTVQEPAEDLSESEVDDVQNPLPSDATGPTRSATFSNADELQPSSLETSGDGIGQTVHALTEDLSQAALDVVPSASFDDSASDFGPSTISISSPTSTGHIGQLLVSGTPSLETSGDGIGQTVQEPAEDLSEFAPEDGPFSQSTTKGFGKSSSSLLPNSSREQTWPTKDERGRYIYPRWIATPAQKKAFRRL
jgi:hypothetical protein